MTQATSDHQAVLAIASQEVQATAENDVNAYLAVLAEDAVYLAPNTTPKTGHELRTWLHEFLEGFKIEWLEYKHGATEVRNDLAYHDYSYVWRVSPKNGEEGPVRRGKGLLVLRRQADGAWKIVRNIWNADPAPTA
jgi:ketosteroid isomerase-like protein